MALSEKLCLCWEDFAANLGNAFHDLKEDMDFTDLTLLSVPIISKLMCTRW